MENFSGVLNGEEQRNSFIKGLIFAIGGMILGAAACIAMLVLFDWIWWWLFGAIIGVGISGGWSLGKGPEGMIRQLFVVLLGVLGGLATLTIGYAIILYNEGFGRDFAAALELTIDHFFTDSRFLIDVLFIVGVAIATAWRKFDKNEVLGSEDTDPEVLYDADSTRTEMEELLGEDIPTLQLDED